MTGDERAILAFEERHPANDRGKEAAVHEAFGISWVRYRRVLLRLVQRQDVLKEFAIVSHRVAHSAEAGLRARAARSFSTLAG
ncbi:DUF3263 domain-containing protein [Curtobacterium sp. Curtsp57]|uniref:DUF3263 domain-containing protein n=1 Tax=Curtobacterium sp. Curtsp57 TaxID=3243047 RepID=UPI0039B6480E